MSKQVGEIIYNLLSNDTSLLGLINTKIYPNMAPQGKDKPAGSYIVYNILSSKRDIGQAVHVRYFKIAISVYSKSYKLSETITMGVIDKLNRFSGLVGDQFVTAILYDEEADDMIEDPQLHHKPSEFTVIITVNN
jgi:hypothetical protein